MTLPNANPPKRSLQKKIPDPSLRFWVVIPLFVLFLLITLTLVFSSLRLGYVPTELFIISVVAFVVFIGPALLVTRLIIRRLEQMIRAAEQVAQGNLTVRINDESYDEIGRLVRAFNNMVQNLGQLQSSRDLLSRTMSPSVRQSLMERGLDFRGITQVVSVLFVDIREFTRITEIHQNTEQLVFFLNDYYTTIANQVHVGGGIIGKYGGDSIMAYFGAPNPEPAEKAATAALLTALALQDTIEELSDRWGFLGLPPIRVGMGLSLGPVVAGPIGSEQQFEYTVIGDPVNLAARLQDLTRSVVGYNIILSLEAYQALEDRIKDQIQVVPVGDYEGWDRQEKVRKPVIFVDLGEVLVKGKKEPVHVYGMPDYRSDPTNGPMKGSSSSLPTTDEN